MKNLNRWCGIGRLGKDPEVRYTAGGAAVATLRIACSDDYKDKSGEKVEKTEWVTVVAWNKAAEIIGEYTKKGSKIYAEGKLTTRKWQDQSGADKYSTEVLLTNFELLDPKKESTSGQKTKQDPPGYPEAFADDQFDDIPF